MEKALNIRNTHYPVIEKVAELAWQERRSISSMGSILLEEAIAAREKAAQPTASRKDEGQGSPH